MPFKDVSIATASYMVEFFKGKPPHSFENHHREMCRERERERESRRKRGRERGREREREKRERKRDRD